MTDCIQVMVTVAEREQAEQIAEILLAAQLAACVQVVGPITSYFRWQGKNEKSSEYLPTIFTSLLQKWDIQTIIYANGPGSFMAIKMSYLFFKSLEIVKGIKLLSASAFDFNKNSPIKAMGKLYFHNTPNEVTIAPLGDVAVCALQLPKQIDKTKFSTKTAPNYVVPAV